MPFNSDMSSNGYLLLLTLLLMSIFIFGVGGWKEMAAPITRLRFYLLIIVSGLLSFMLSIVTYIPFKNEFFDYFREYEKTGIVDYLILTIIHGGIWITLGRQLVRLSRWTVYVTLFKIFLMLSFFCGLLSVLTAGSIDSYGSVQPGMVALFCVWFGINTLIFGCVLLCVRTRFRAGLEQDSQRTGSIMDFLSLRAFTLVFILICIQGGLRFYNNNRVCMADTIWVVLSASVCYILLILIFQRKYQLRGFWMISFVASLLWQGYLLYRPIPSQIPELQLTYHVRQAASSRMDQEQLRRLYQMNEHRIDKALAENANTPGDVFNELRKNSNEDIQASLNANPGFQKLIKQKLKKGDRLFLRQSIDTIGRTGWWEDGNFPCHLPKGTIMRVYKDQEEIQGEFWAVPEDYKSLEAGIVPEKVRRSPNYRGFFFIFEHKDFGAIFSPES